MIAVLLAAAVTLGWNPSEGAALYRLYVGIQSMQAGNPPLVSYTANITQFEVTGLDRGRKYFFVVTAISANGLESGYSNEVAYTPARGRKH